MSYEILIEEREPIDGWTVCTVCLNVERTANGWRGSVALLRLRRRHVEQLVSAR